MQTKEASALLDSVSVQDSDETRTWRILFAETWTRILKPSFVSGGVVLFYFAQH